MVWDVLWSVSFSNDPNLTAIMRVKTKSLLNIKHYISQNCDISSTLPTLICAFVSECLVYKCGGRNCIICFEKYIMIV